MSAHKLILLLVLVLGVWTTLVSSLVSNRRKKNQYVPISKYAYAPISSNSYAPVNSYPLGQVYVAPLRPVGRPVAAHGYAPRVKQVISPIAGLFYAHPPQPVDDHPVWPSNAYPVVQQHESDFYHDNQVYEYQHVPIAPEPVHYPLPVYNPFFRGWGR